MHWGLMVGNDPWAYQGIFYPNGQRRPTGSFIKDKKRENKGLSLDGKMK